MEKQLSKHTLVDHKRKLKYHKVYIPISYYEELLSIRQDKESIGDIVHRLFEYHKEKSRKRIEVLVMGPEGLIPKEELKNVKRSY